MSNDKRTVGRIEFSPYKHTPNTTELTTITTISDSTKTQYELYPVGTVAKKDARIAELEAALRDISDVVHSDNSNRSVDELCSAISLLAEAGSDNE